MRIGDEHSRWGEDSKKKGWKKKKKEKKKGKYKKKTNKKGSLFPRLYVLETEWCCCWAGTK